MIKHFKNFYNTYGIYYIEIWITHLVSLFGLFFLPFEYFVCALLLFWILLPLTQLTTHEYISHEYIKPKNQVLTIVLLCLVYWLTKHTIFSKKNFHFYHHKCWRNPDQDPTLQKMQGIGLLPYLFGIVKPVAHNIPTTESSLLRDDVFVNWLDKKSSWIHYGSRIVMLIILPVEWFVVINAYFVSLTMMRSNFSEYYFHGPLKGQDKSWLCIFFGNGVWHIRHHKISARLYFGPKQWKWLTLSWYYYLAFFIPWKNQHG